MGYPELVFQGGVVPVASRLVTLVTGLLALLLVACGGDGGAATTTTVTTGAASPSTTGAPTGTTAPPTTTAPATTAVSVPDDIHPAWGVSWEDLWPPDGSTAVVRAEAAEGTIDAEIGLDYGVEWDGALWDRIWLGSPDPAGFGVSFYLRRPAPWVVVLWGAHSYSGGGFEMTERCDPPLTLDLRLLPEGRLSAEATLLIEGPFDQSDQGAYSLLLSLVGFEDVTVAAGQFTNTAHLHLTAVEPGGYRAETDIWVDAEQALVSLVPAHVFQSLELAAPWSE